MSSYPLKPFMLNFKDMVIEEIALEGLQGIGIDLLFRRLEDRISDEITQKMRSRIWDFIVNCKSIFLYEVPEPLPHVNIIDRFSIVDEMTGDLKEPDEFVDGPYEYYPIEKEYGCCWNYQIRKSLPKNADLSYDEVMEQYNSMLVMVASIEERWAALAPHMPISYLSQLTPVHYCILEVVGKARHNGQMTVGKTNLTKITKDPKLLFYNRKVLQDMDLIKTSRVTQVTAGRGAINGILLRLKKFHKSFIQSIPKSGTVRNLVNYLKSQPNYCEKTELILKKGLLTQKQNKRYHKNISIFGFEEDPVKFEDIPILRAKAKSNIKPEDTSIKKGQPKPHLRRRYIYLCSHSDESSQSEDDEITPALECQYKVGVNLLRQSYERILEAGLKGLTQMELARLVGMEFYISRTVCKIFKSRKIVREFLEDKGRQRQARFIAVAVNAKMDNKYAEEKEKFEKLLVENNMLVENKKRKPSIDADSEIPKKKKKTKGKEDNVTEDMDSEVTEMKVIDGLSKDNLKALSKTGKSLTLRQLKFANGLLKVLRDKTYVIGYQTLSRLVSIEINEPPMDSKALKSFLQKLVLDEHIKIYKIKWPHITNKFSTLICAPHVKSTDPTIRAKQKEITLRAITNKTPRRLPASSATRPVMEYTYPRYVKVQKLHEAITNYVYFDRVKPESSDSQGFVYIKELIPELTVEVALGHLNTASIDVSKKALIDECLDIKVRDAPEALKKVLLKSSNLYNSIRSVIKVLAAFGLIQLVAQIRPTELPDNTLGVHLLYVNKHAMIIDTSGNWPRKNTPTKPLQKEFFFRSFEDVQHYWNSVYSISMGTTIALSIRNRDKTPKVPVHTKDEVFDLDNGTVYGNGHGACGFDSCFFVDLPRLWKVYSMKKNQVIIPQTVKIPRFERTKRKRKAPPKKPRIKYIVEDATEKSVVKPLPTKPVAAKSQGPLPPPARMSKKTYDSWSRDEDRLLMMCKLAISIMSPVSQPGCLQIRNLVAKDILSMKDPLKTQKVCHRRAKSLDSNTTITHEQDCLMRELRRNYYHIIRKYENQLKKIRIFYTANMSKYINEARVPLMELVWSISQVFKITSFRSQGPGGQMSAEEFFKNYTIVPSSANKPCNTYKTPHEDVTIASLKESIVQTVLLSYNRKMPVDDAKKTLANYERYQERVLRIAIDQLRKSGSICAKEKIFNNQMHKANLDDIVQCCYKITAQYQRKWVLRLGPNYFENLATCFDRDKDEDNLPGAPDLNCFTFEQQTNQALDIILVSTPVISGFAGTMIQEEQLNSFDIESKYKLKSGTFGWKSNVGSLTELYKDIKLEDHLPSIKMSVIECNKLQEIKKKKLSEEETIIVNYLNTKIEKGATFQELKEFSKYNSKYLIEILKKLDEADVIRRVGFYENAVVSVDYFKAWTMRSGDLLIFPTPWRDLDGSIQNDLFIKWTSVIVNKVFESPGCSISHLADNCEFLSCRSVQEICETLLDVGCIAMHTLPVQSVDLFSDDDAESTELDAYNPYESPQNIVVLPVTDTLSRFAFIKQKFVI